MICFTLKLSEPDIRSDITGSTAPFGKYNIHARLMTEHIGRVLREKGTLVVTVDGFCASGKTTVSGLISEMFESRIIHMDDFFLPKEKRTPERYGEAGGNVDYERFFDEVILHLKDASLTYGIFDCSSMTVNSNAVLPRRPLTIIEGAYSNHPYFGAYPDIRIFMETDDITQRERIIKRNGAAAYARFAEKWIPFEKKYVSEYGIRDIADYIINT